MAGQAQTAIVGGTSTGRHLSTSPATGRKPSGWSSPAYSSSTPKRRPASPCRPVAATATSAVTPMKARVRRPRQRRPIAPIEDPAPRHDRAVTRRKASLLGHVLERDHVVYESRLELSRLIFADFDWAVQRIAKGQLHAGMGKGRGGAARLAT